MDATVDPLGGSWFVEALTDETERQVWRYLDEIDRRGGMVAAITEGYPQHEIADAAYRYQREFDAGRAAGRRDQRLRRREPSRRRSRSWPCRPVPRSATWRGSRGPAANATPGAVEAALRGLRETAARPGVERDEPDAAFHPLRRGVRHARRAVRGPARGLRRVPRAGGGLMYLDALEFLEEERDAWAPFEALAGLTDEQLAVPVAGAHGWSGRQLMAHLLAWQENALAVATELAVNETSPAKARADADWDARGGEVVNDEIDATLGGAPDGRAARALRVRCPASSAAT